MSKDITVRVRRTDSGYTEHNFDKAKIMVHDRWVRVWNHDREAYFSPENTLSIVVEDHAAV